MKQSTNLNTGTCCSRRQKIWGVVALLGLFTCGWMVGVSINNWRADANNNTAAVKHIYMSETDCDTIAYNIAELAKKRDCDDSCVAKLRELNDIYLQNCNGRIVMPKPQPVHNDTDTSNLQTCELIEHMLLDRVLAEDSTDPVVHSSNIEVYKHLIEDGCSENREKYAALIEREQKILSALTNNLGTGNALERTCDKIEKEVKQQIYGYVDLNSSGHMHNAQVYANLSERGCPENRDEYIALARQEIELARALTDDKSQQETEDAIRTYKRLQMQAAAQEVLDKVQKLTNPAIDFIIEMQQIINE